MPKKEPAPLTTRELVGLAGQVSLLFRQATGRALRFDTEQAPEITQIIMDAALDHGIAEADGRRVVAIASIATGPSPEAKALREVVKNLVTAYGSTDYDDFPEFEKDRFRKALRAWAAVNDINPDDESSFMP